MNTAKKLLTEDTEKSLRTLREKCGSFVAPLGIVSNTNLLSLRALSDFSVSSVRSFNPMEAR
jgi:hypothetical protein